MEVIDGKWIAARLDSGRGSKAALADALGVRADVVSKILSGTRRVQPEEIPKVLAYFDATASQQFSEGYPRLDDEGKRLIDEMIRQLLAAQDRR